MAGSVIRGLINNGYPRERIGVSAPSKKNTATLAADFAIQCDSDNQTVVRDADIVVLGVKPQILKSVCEEIGSYLREKVLLISLAAGVTCDSIQEWIGRECSLVRCMSNTPAQITFGASGLYANANVNEQQKAVAENIISSVGVSCWVEDEALIDTVTALAGSGPAYFFLFMESMIDAAEAQGMDRETANSLAIQTALGAAQLAKNSEYDLVQLRKNVTSPKGTTEKAIESFETEGLREIVAKAMHACVERAQQLAKQL